MAYRITMDMVGHAYKTLKREKTRQAMYQRATAMSHYLDAQWAQGKVDAATTWKYREHLREMVTIVDEEKFGMRPMFSK